MTLGLQHQRYWLQIADFLVVELLCRMLLFAGFGKPLVNKLECNKSFQHYLWYCQMLGFVSRKVTCKAPLVLQCIAVVQRLLSRNWSSH